MDVSVLYYSADTETDRLSDEVRRVILANKGDLPLVSVTQKPHPDFGTNICVGEQENGYHNEFRQIQYGLREITTPYVLVCESDTLYPASYFSFVPTETRRAYRYDNTWVHYSRWWQSTQRRPHFRFKGYSDACQCVDREMWLEKIDLRLAGTPEWCAGACRMMQFGIDYERTWSGDPVLTFKTGLGVRHNTAVKRYPNGQPITEDELPVWGRAQELWEGLFNAE